MSTKTNLTFLLIISLSRISSSANLRISFRRGVKSIETLNENNSFDFDKFYLYFSKNVYLHCGISGQHDDSGHIRTSQCEYRARWPDPVYISKFSQVIRCCLISIPLKRKFSFLENCSLSSTFLVVSRETCSFIATRDSSFNSLVCKVFISLP